MDTIAIPLRFQNGAIRTYEEGSDQFYAHLLAFALRTEPGELILSPRYGVTDPTFEQLQTVELASLVAQYVPEISVTGFDTEPDDSGRVEVTINFEKK